MLLVQSRTNRSKRLFCAPANLPYNKIVTQTLEKPKTAGPLDGLGGQWRVIVLNDNHNSFESVAGALSAILPSVDYNAGLSYANQIHNKGQAIVWSGRRELAELYHQLLCEHGLTVAPLEQG